MAEDTVENAWKAIGDGVQKSGKTQRYIAAATGISTSTLNKITGNGEGRRPDCQNMAPHIRREWVRILASLAFVVFDDKPTARQKVRGWLQGLGLQWDSKTVDEALRQSGRKSAESHLTGTDPTLAEILATKTIRAAVMVFPPFAEDNGFDVSFLVRYSRPLFNSILPSVNLELEKCTDIETALEDLLTPQPNLDVIVGLLDTIPRRLRGIEFVRVPELSSRLSAMEVTRPNGDGIGYKASQILAPGSELQARFRAAVIEGESGHLFVAGACGYSDSRMIKLQAEDAASMLDGLEREAERFPLLFVADVSICKRLYEAAQQAGTIALRHIEDAFLPRYRLAIAVRADSPRWKSVIETAQIEVMRESLRMYTIELYISLLERARELGFKSYDVYWKSELARPFTTDLEEQLKDRKALLSWLTKRA